MTWSKRNLAEETSRGFTHLEDCHFWPCHNVSLAFSFQPPSHCPKASAGGCSLPQQIRALPLLSSRNLKLLPASSSEDSIHHPYAKLLIRSSQCCKRLWHPFPDFATGTKILGPWVFRTPPDAGARLQLAAAVACHFLGVLRAGARASNPARLISCESALRLLWMR